MSDIITLYTNAPRSYDYPQNVEAGIVRGCRVIECPKQTVDYQIGRYQSGLYWATEDIEMAAYLRERWPCEAAEGGDA
jgi:hypothetical protein